MPGQDSQHAFSRLDSWVNTILIGVSLGILLSFLLIVTDAYRDYRAQSQTREQLSVFRSALSAMEAVSAERGPTNGLLGGQGGDLAQLVASRRVSDQRLDAFAAALATCPSCRAMPHSLEDIRSALTAARKQVDDLLGYPVEQRTAKEQSAAIDAMFDVVAILLPLADWASRDMLRRTPQAGAPLYNAYWAAQLRELAGQVGSLLTPALAKQRPLDAAETERLHIAQGRIGQLQLQLALTVEHLPKQFAGDNQRDMQTAYQQMSRDFFEQGLSYQRGTVSALNTGHAPSAAHFASHYVPTMNSILALRDTALRLTEIELQRSTQDALMHLALVAGTALALLLLLAASLVWLKRRVLDPLLASTHKMTALLVQAEPSADESRQFDRFSISNTLHELERQLRQAYAVRLERDALINQLKTYAQTDHLTGLANRRAFDARLKDTSQKDDALLAVILFDIDHFKRINDTYGHPAGDRLLQTLAARCIAQMRNGERIARIGGEEFAIQLCIDSGRTALQLAERLRTAIDKTPFDIGLEQPIHVTASFGVALTKAAHAADIDALMERADNALYRAKRDGRNRCALAAE